MTASILTTLFNWAKAKYSLPAGVKDPHRVYLPFTMQYQMMDNWCWAAVASSVAFHFDEESMWTQPELAAEAFGYSEADLPDASWDKEYHLVHAFNFVGCLREVLTGHVGFRMVLDELRNGRPVCLHIDWKNGKGHAVAITGCWVDSMDTKHYRVDDPGLREEDYGDFWDEIREIPERQLMTRYMNVGTWRNTFLVEQPIVDYVE
ncbi:hypothetical protein HFO33_32535 [Rhizobium leguminosarum]|uniref:papain-like cysteine protease family protein n=1 Tax=Rhizobium leguminosarum TaxID=384 RepID=UPI001C96A974|nr:papain-like cysteine protease family protein [Rhizobium leguminosarum]MBY5721233.1 hypothetical protein [Rhizobium leguminosarum]